MNSTNELFTKILFFMMMMMIIFLIMNNKISPLNLMLNLFIFTFISLISNFIMTQKSLPCFMIFLIMISSNMIMFLYFTSLINNYFNKLIKSMIKFSLMSILLLILITLIYLMNNKMTIPSNYIMKLNSIFKIYEYPLYLLTLSMILYLMLTLLMAMKICLLKYKPLRKIKK